jgi:Arc/MetJ family transcription regulator
MTDAMRATLADTPQEQTGSALRHAVRIASAERLPAPHRPIRWGDRVRQR